MLNPTRRAAPASVVVLTLLALSGCSLFGSSDPMVRLTTDREHYDLSATDSIVVTAKNISGSVLYYSRCTMIAAEKLAGNRVLDARSPVTCACICEAPLAPGATWTYVVRPSFFSTFFSADDVVEAAPYRFRVGFFEDSALGTPLSDKARRTNVFTIAP